MVERPVDLPRRRAWRAAAFVAGLLLTLAFAPRNIWPLALACPAFLIWLWSRAPGAREGAWLGFAFGLGTFSAGTWWLYISIHVFGQAPVWVAFIVMAALVLIMAAYYGALGYAVVRWLPTRSPLGLLVAIPAAWLLLEWWRGWFLSGFPWLSLGYTQTDTWLAGFAPVGGVYLVSALLLVGAGALVLLLQSRDRWRWVALALLLAPWAIGAPLRAVQWTRSDGAAVDVAIAQGAIPQDMKWLASNRDAILDTYERLHREALGARLIVWPESALPDLVNNLAPYVGAAWSAADARGSTVLMGVMRLADDNVNYYNSVLALGDGEPAFYDKHHLVPFGEYFPVPGWVRSWLRLMSLPNSDFTAGGDRQGPLVAGGLRVATSICYEDAYTGIHFASRQSQLLVNVTNDAWFGHSAARYQHLQISRMRAAESRRCLLRAANDGVSAIVGPGGEVVATAPEFKPAVLRGRILPQSGDTPYLVAGNAPIIGLAALAVSFATLRRRKLNRGPQVQTLTGTREV